MAGRPPLIEGVPSAPYYTPSRNGKNIVARGLLRLNGKTDPLQGTGRTQKEAFAAYLANGELRRTRTKSATTSHTLDSKLGEVIEEWRRRQREQNRRNRAGTSLDVYMSEVFVSSDEKRAKKGVIKIEDLAKLTIRQVTKPILIAHVDTILALGYNAKAQRHRLLLIEIMQIPVEWGILDANPALAIPEIPDLDANPRALGPQDLTALRSQMQRWVMGLEIPGIPAVRPGDYRDPSILDIFEVGLALTTRPGETLALVWEEPGRDDAIPGGIDLDTLDDDGNPAPFAWVTGKITQVRGSAIQREPHTKTGEDGIRCMPIPLYALPLFRRLRDWHRSSATRNPLKLVFPSGAGTPRYPNNVRRVWNQVRGTEFAWVTMGTTRKTGATKIMEKLGPAAAAAQLGHTSEKNVKFYAKTPPRIVGWGNAAALSEFAPEQQSASHIPLQRR